MHFQAQPGRSFFTQQDQIIGAAVDAIHPTSLPGGESGGGFAVLLILDKSLMIPVVMAGYGRGMRSPGRMDYGADPKTGSDHPIGVAADDLRGNDFFGCDDNMAAG